MKKSLIATALLALTLATSGTALAAVTTKNIVHQYGNGAGQVDPFGTDVLGNGFVTVADNSSTPFSDSFSFSSLGYSSISKLVLTLNYSNVSGYNEFWMYHIGSKTVISGALASTSGNSSKTLEYTFMQTYYGTTFASMVKDQELKFWFTEHNLNKNDFRLNSASLAVTGVPAVPEPETYAMLMAGLGLMGTIARRKKQDQA